MSKSSQITNKIKWWLFEYSFKNGQNLNYIKDQRDPPAAIEGLQNTYLAVYFLKTVFDCIWDTKVYQNVGKLEAAIKVLEKIYTMSLCKTVPVLNKIDLLFKIKMLILIQSLHVNTITPKLVRDHFPLWTEDKYEEECKNIYKIQDESQLKYIQDYHTSCRLYFLCITKMDINKRKALYDKLMNTEMKDIFRRTEKLYNQLMVNVLPLMPDTTIEKIIRGTVTKKELGDSNDRAIRMLISILNESVDNGGIASDILLQIVLEKLN